MRSRPLPTRSITSEDFVRIVADGYRHQAMFDPEAEPDMELTAGSTVYDWRCACDLLRWRRLGRALNQGFGVEVSDSTWSRVLEPARRRYLGDVGRFLAARGARVPMLEPRGGFGARCTAAGAFDGIRAALAADGTDVARIWPSSALAPYVDEHVAIFIEFAARVAPGRLPTVSMEGRFWRQRPRFGALETFRDYAACLA